jgi:hypothetical protein
MYPRLASNLQSSCLNISKCWDHKCAPPHLAFYKALLPGLGLFQQSGPDLAIVKSIFMEEAIQSHHFLFPNRVLQRPFREDGNRKEPAKQYVHRLGNRQTQGLCAAPGKWHVPTELAACAQFLILSDVFNVGWQLFSWMTSRSCKWVILGACYKKNAEGSWKIYIPLCLSLSRLFLIQVLRQWRIKMNTGFRAM